MQMSNDRDHSEFSSHGNTPSLTARDDPHGDRPVAVSEFVNKATTKPLRTLRGDTE
jgi:hypothetical protein